jgi:anti-anti-sigma factor
MSPGQDAYARHNGSAPHDGGRSTPLPRDPGGERPLDLDVRAHGDGRAAVAVGGEIDFATHRSLLSALTDLIEQGRPRIVLDLSRVSFCDSTGLGVMVQIRQRVVGVGGWLRLAGPTEPVRRALEITNLDRLIPAYPTVAEALDAP